MEEQFLINVTTEKQHGLLTRVLNNFNKKRLSIENMVVTNAGKLGYQKYSIVVESNQETIEKAVLQIRRVIGVHDVSYYPHKEVNNKEIVLYRLTAQQLIENFGFYENQTSTNSYSIKDSPVKRHKVLC